MSFNLSSLIPNEITLQDYCAHFQNKIPHLLIDVREPEETKISSLSNTHAYPLMTLVSKSEDLSKNQWIILYCHHGMRSLRACHLLREKGFDKVMSLKGGIHRWSLEIDPSIPLY